MPYRETSKKGAALQAGLLPQLKSHPDATLVEHCQSRNRRANITLLAALSLQGMGEALVLEGSADTAVFELYVEHILAPSLLPGHIVILDNLNTHTGEKAKQVIEAQGCQLLFLPSFSPDLSPIEEAFSPPQSLFTAGRGAHSRSSRGSHWTSTPHGQFPGCLGVVYPLWIRF